MQASAHRVGAAVRICCWENLPINGQRACLLVALPTLAQPLPASAQPTSSISTVTRHPKPFGELAKVSDGGEPCAYW